METSKEFTRRNRKRRRSRRFVGYDVDDVHGRSGRGLLVGVACVRDILDGTGLQAALRSHAERADTLVCRNCLHAGSRSDINVLLVVGGCSRRCSAVAVSSRLSRICMNISTISSTSPPVLAHSLGVLRRGRSCLLSITTAAGVTVNQPWRSLSSATMT